MRVLVTGVSGTIGGAVARALLANGHEVVGVSRSGAGVPNGVRPMAADLLDPAALVGLDADAAVHAASSNDERAGRLDEVVVDTLLATFAGSGRPLVYTSGLWVHGDTGDRPAVEDSPLAPPLVVSWRPDLERRVAAGADRGVRTVRIRPGLVYGGGRGYLPMLFAPHDDGVVRHFGAGENHLAVVHSDDLADLYVLAVERAPAGAVYLGVTDQTPRLREAAAAAAAGAPVAAWDPTEARQHWGVLVDAFLLDQRASAAHARDQLGWRPHRPDLLAELSAVPTTST